MIEISIISFKSQCFSEIKSKCLRERQLFVDPEFTHDVAVSDGIIDNEPEKTIGSNSNDQGMDENSEYEKCVGPISCNPQITCNPISQTLTSSQPSSPSLTSAQCPSTSIEWKRANDLHSNPR